MKRRRFLNSAAGAAAATLGGAAFTGASLPDRSETQLKAGREAYPLAITMWEFSWLERRWTGAGYEDWDRALSELVERGYDAVRIDAFPHLIYEDPEKEYLLLPVWSTQDWGSPEINRFSPISTGSWNVAGHMGCGWDSPPGSGPTRRISV
jgi:hypothetical protein